jgi:hypothetical protein
MKHETDESGHHMPPEQLLQRFEAICALADPDERAIGLRDLLRSCPCLSPGQHLVEQGNHAREG